MRAATTLQLMLLVVITLFMLHIAAHVLGVYAQLGLVGQ